MSIFPINLTALRNSFRRLLVKDNSFDIIKIWKVLPIFFYNIDYTSKKIFLATVMLLSCNNMTKNSINVYYLPKRLYTSKNILWSVFTFSVKTTLVIKISEKYVNGGVFITTSIRITTSCKSPDISKKSWKFWKFLKFSINPGKIPENIKSSSPHLYCSFL